MSLGGFASASLLASGGSRGRDTSASCSVKVCWCLSPVFRLESASHQYAEACVCRWTRSPEAYLW